MGNHILSKIILFGCIESEQGRPRWLYWPLSSSYDYLRNHSQHRKRIFWGSGTTFSRDTVLKTLLNFVSLYLPSFVRKNRLLPRNTLFLRLPYLFIYVEVFLLISQSSPAGHNQGTLIVFRTLLKLFHHAQQFKGLIPFLFQKKFFLIRTFNLIYIFWICVYSTFVALNRINLMFSLTP